MTFVITQNCCNDTACVDVCPVGCIHPTPDDPDYGTAEMLYINPQTCIDCGACVDVCPVDAIFPDHNLSDQMLPFQDLNARFFTDPDRVEPAAAKPPRRAPRHAPGGDELRVAVIGSGPAACYLADDLASRRGLAVRIDLFERLLTPGGLVRFGVAPDHQRTKTVLNGILRRMRRDAFRLFLDVEVGRDVSLEDLRERYHAVVLAVGAAGGRQLGIEGEHLLGSHAASDFVAWYNGHPDAVDPGIDLSAERAVIIGNGNVALDAARILLLDEEALAATDVADGALEQLSRSSIREVVVVGRRGPAQAAFTSGELLGLLNLPGVDVRVEGLDAWRPRQAVSDSSTMAAYKVQLLEEVAQREPRHDHSITLRFGATPQRVLGAERVDGIELAPTVVADGDGKSEVLSCGLVLRAVGYRGHPVEGLPFDEARGVVPSVDGRIVDPGSGEAIPGLYATGWIKRGPSGGIGTNKHCAHETAESLLADMLAGRLPVPSSPDDIDLRLSDRPRLPGWEAIDAYERSAGAEVSRPRVKIVDRAQLRDIARGAKTS